MRHLVSYRPRNLNVFENLDRVFDSFLTDSPARRSVSPAVDIREIDDSYVLEAELPGLTEKDVDVKVEDTLLTISSKTEDEKEEEKNGYLVRERRAASFSRCFVLPKDVDRENISASFSNGLLQLALPKSPETKPRSIEVKVAK